MPQQKTVQKLHDTTLAKLLNYFTNKDEKVNYSQKPGESVKDLINRVPVNMSTVSAFEPLVISGAMIKSSGSKVVDTLISPQSKPQAGLGHGFFLDKDADLYELIKNKYHAYALEKAGLWPSALDREEFIRRNLGEMSGVLNKHSLARIRKAAPSDFGIELANPLNLKQEEVLMDYFIKGKPKFVSTELAKPTSLGAQSFPMTNSKLFIDEDIKNTLEHIHEYYKSSPIKSNISSEAAARLERLKMFRD